MGPSSPTTSNSAPHNGPYRRSRPRSRWYQPLSTPPCHHNRPPLSSRQPDNKDVTTNAVNQIRFDKLSLKSKRDSTTTMSHESNNNNNKQTRGCDRSDTTLRRTSQITHRPSNHGTLRRQQRNIGVRDLQAAIKYGTRTKLGPSRYRGSHHQKNGTQRRNNKNNPRSKYEYNGITYIVDDITKQEITSYSQPINLKYKVITLDDRNHHDNVQKQILSKEGIQKWKSHTVFLVDKSGSMRNSDVNGSKTRLQAVYLAIAQDFVAQRLEAGQAKDIYDVVTLVLVGDEPNVILDCVPTDWILYNTFVDFFYGKYPKDLQTSSISPHNHTSKPKRTNTSVVEPGGHGNFIPAIKLAHDVFINGSGSDTPSCTLTLALLSDGRPSDMSGSQQKTRIEVMKYTSDMASQLGARFNLHTIGMGSSDHQFDLLQDMVSLCKDYGSKGEFQLPSLSTSGLGVAFSSLASSVTVSQMELTNTLSSQNKRIRPAHRERASMVPLLTEVVTKDEFTIVMHSDVIRMEYNKEKKTFQEVSLIHPKACGVALRKKAFGEGGERLAYQFFEVGADGQSVLGEPMVAKLSRYIEDDYNVSSNTTKHKSNSTTTASLIQSNNRSPSFERIGSAMTNNHVDSKVGIKDEAERNSMMIDQEKSNKRDKFMQIFCERQQKAMTLAQQFNDKLDTIPRLDPGTPRVTFVDCSVYYLNLTTTATTMSPDDGTPNTTTTTNELAFLVEPKVNGKFQKWNSNNGYVGKAGDTTPKKPSQKDDSNNNKKKNNNTALITLLDEGNNEMRLGTSAENAIDVDTYMLDDIAEGNEEDDEDEEEYIYVSPSEVAQAFSHFSYFQSGGKILLVDLQGEYNRYEKMFYFTDPVIHYYNKHNPGRTTLYGRTDMGRKGMTKFFDTHCCNELCYLMVRGFKSALRPPPPPVSANDPDSRKRSDQEHQSQSKRQRTCN